MLTTQSNESQDSTHGANTVQAPHATSRRRRLVWAVVALVLLTVVSLRVSGVIGPKPCTACHDRDAFRAQTQASPHADVDCRQCHVPSGVLGQATFALQRPLHAYFPQVRPANRDAATVPDRRCRACHEQALKGVVDTNGIRMRHESCATTASCTDCHSTTAHGSATRWVRSYDMDDCLECHVAAKNVDCNLCHKGRNTAERVEFAAFSVTHGPKWETTHGMGDAATCTVCHTASDCADCHGPGVPHEPKFLAVHASYATQSDARCVSCHKDAFCGGCHGTEMPHPSGFTRRHATASKNQPEVCSRCHAETDCTNCHLKHVHPGGAVSRAVPGGGTQ
jgi:hypothetical protein